MPAKYQFETTPADVNGPHHVSAATNAKIQGILTNPRITGPVHLGTELTKVIFTKEEMVGSTLTGRKVDGQCRQLLNTGRLALLTALFNIRSTWGKQLPATAVQFVTPWQITANT